MVQADRHIDKIVCFVDKEYRRVGCSKTGNVKCGECSFCQKYEGKEKRYFFYTRWIGVTDKNNLKGYEVWITMIKIDKKKNGNCI